MSIRAGELPALLHCLGQLLQHGLCILHPYASVCDADAVLQPILALLRQALLPFLDIALDHDPYDARLSRFDLLRHRPGDLGLIPMVLLAVAMAAINHQALPQPRLPQLLPRLPYTRRPIIRPTLPSPQNRESVFIPHRPHNGHDARLRHAQEMVRMPDRADRIHSHVQAPVRPVLEPHGKAEPAGELPVDLALGGARADGADAEQVGEELRGDGVEHLAGEGHAGGGEVDEEAARRAQALVDVEGGVDVRVVDQALPPDRRARLLEVGAHHDEQLAGVPLLQREQPPGVVARRGRVVDAAGADDDEEAVEGVGAGDDGHGLVARRQDGGLGGGRLRDLGLEQVRRRERVVASDAPVFAVGAGAHVGVGDVVVGLFVVWGQMVGWGVFMGTGEGGSAYCHDVGCRRRESIEEASSGAV